MQLIFIYGPPAVGKLTVAKELSKILNIPLVDNHSMVTPLAKVFGWGHPEQKRLGDTFRFELFEAAAKENRSLITTFGGGGKYYDGFIQRVRSIIESHGGEVVFIRLVAPKEVLFERVDDQSRIDKFTVSDKERLADLFERVPDVFERALVPDHFEIDTSKYTPKEAAEIIARESFITR